MNSSFSNRRAVFAFRAGMFAAALMIGVAAANAGPIVNIAGSGTGIFGNTTDTSMTGTSYAHAGSTAAINDNDVTTHVDSWPQTTNDYVGVTFATPVNNFNVQSVGLVMAMFVDGGWYGPSNTTPGSGNPLTAGDLLAPTLQVTTDGTHWTNVATTNNYVSTMTGAGIGGGANPNPNNSPLTTFTLNTAVVGIEGIRLIGNGGGVAGNGGFIGVSEFYVNATATPEPSALVLAGLAMLCGLGLVVGRRTSLVPQLASRSTRRPKVPTALLLVLVALVMFAASPAYASTIPGNAIMGVNAGGSSVATTGTPFSQFGSLGSLTDGNTGTYDTTCCGTTGSPFADSYVGLNFTSPVTSPAGLKVDVVFHTFVDGGWFGNNGSAPNPLASALVAPILQVSTNGTNWTTVPSVSNYISTLSGLSPVFQATGDVTFSENASVSGITEIRLIGPNGGTQPGNNGFLGVAEISATITPTPEPSTFVLGGLGLVGLVVAARRRRR